MKEIIRNILESVLIICPKFCHLQISLYFLPYYEGNAERFAITFLYTFLYSFSYIRLVTRPSLFSNLLPFLLLSLAVLLVCLHLSYCALHMWYS